MKSWKRTSNPLPRLLLLSALALPLPFLAGCNNQSDSSEATSHITRADTYANQGQYRSALLEVQNAIQADPDNVGHIVRLAELYLTIGAFERASDLLEPWLADHPEDVALLLARAYVERGKQLSATETLEAFSPDSPEEQLEAYLIRAEALRLSGKTAEALARYRDLADSHNANVEAATGVARSHLDLNEPSKAIDVLDKWISKNGPEAKILYWKGVAHYQENQLEVASETLTEAASILPTSDILLPIRRDLFSTLSRVLTEQGKITEAQVYNRILAENLDTRAVEQGKAAMAAIQDGNIDEAKTILRDMLKLNPDNEQIALMLGAYAASTGELEEGTRLLTENLDPETTPTQFIRAATIAQIDAGDREDALKTLERAIEARPTDNELLVMHGFLALSLPDHQEAGVKSLSKAISNEPSRVGLRLALAQHYIRKNQPEQALGQLRTAFNANPADWNTTSNYLNLLIQQGEITEATEIRDSLLNGYGEEPAAVMLASITDAQLGNIDAAKKRLESLVKHSPQLQAPKVALGRLYAQTGQNDQALATMVDAARLTPDVIQPLQQATQIYAQNHTVAEVEQWLGKLGQENPELNQNADVLAALINIRQSDLAEARSLLSEWQSSDSMDVRLATGELLGAEALTAADSADFATARSKAAEAIALQPDNLNLALIPVRIAALETSNQQGLEILDEVETTFGEQSAIVRARAQLLGRDNRPEEAIGVLETYYEKTSDLAVLPDLINFALRARSGKADRFTKDWVMKSPNSPAAQLTRADYLMQQGSEIEAASHYERVLEQQSENTAALNNLAWTLRERDRSRALSLAKRAAELAPQSGAVLDTYGWILHLDGQHHAAEEQLKRALELQPESEEIAQHLEQVRQAL